VHQRQKYVNTYYTRTLAHLWIIKSSSFDALHTKAVTTLRSEPKILCHRPLARFKCILELSRSQEHKYNRIAKQQSAYIFALLIDQPSRRNCISHCAGQLQHFYLYNAPVEGVCVEYIIE
jgi:hypothetical protein